MPEYNLDALIADLCNPRQGERGLEIFSHLESSEAKKVLTQAFAQRNVKERGYLVLALGHLDRPFVIQALIERLSADDSDIVRAMAAFSLANFKNREAAPALINALHDSSWKVILSACRTLQTLGLSEVATELFALLQHDNWMVRLSAAETLLQFGVKDVRILDALELLTAQPEAREHDEMITELTKLKQQLDNEDTPIEDQISIPQSLDEILAEARRVILAPD